MITFLSILPFITIMNWQYDKVFYGEVVKKS